MPSKTKQTPARPKTQAPGNSSAEHLLSLKDEVQAALEWLESHSSKQIREEMAPRYGIHTDKAYGVSVANIQLLARNIGRNHDLALALWDTGWYEARMLASFVDEPERVTPAQMDSWCRDFDNWGICDTVCFHLFDRTPHAFSKVAQWSRRRDEFVRRGAFALLACLALHNKHADNEYFIESLSLIEKAASDERNFVKKSVNWALRAIGRRNAELKAASIEVAERLAASQDATSRWVGKDALRKFTGSAALRM